MASKPPTKAEVTALLVGWKALERSRAAARLQVERSSLKDSRAAVRTIVSSAADRLEGIRNAPRLSKMTALAAIQAASGQLRDQVAASVADGRDDARTASLSRANAEIEHLSSLLSKDGWSGSELPGPVAPDVPDTDAIRAAAAGASVSSRWAALALGAVSQWEADGGSLPTALRRTTTLLDPHLSRAIATEISEAFADEHLAALEPLSDYPWSAQVFKVWSAILDGRLCQRCYELDGRAVPLNHSWPEGATQPLHPHCRCMEVPLYIPKPARLQDTASDYSAYKAEIRDQIRESRGKRDFGRTAGQFVERSRVGRSPTVISKDFAVGRLARRTGT